ncbi:MAG: hypothetical protein GY861_19685 [bacterium]|nr:hypothetical protein [bacterium]
MKKSTIITTLFIILLVISVFQIYQLNEIKNTLEPDEEETEKPAPVVVNTEAEEDSILPNVEVIND